MGQMGPWLLNPFCLLGLSPQIQRRSKRMEERQMIMVWLFQLCKEPGSFCILGFEDRKKLVLRLRSCMNNT